MEQAEFDAMMDDPDKFIDGDISWNEDVDHSPAVEFRVEVRSNAGYPLHLNGRYSPRADTLSFTLIHRSVGRVYALDLGADHPTPPNRTLVGDPHKHRWTVLFGDKSAYSPPDITATIDEVVEVWKQFCSEARIQHKGVLDPIPPSQEDLFP